MGMVVAVIFGVLGALLVIPFSYIWTVDAKHQSWHGKLLDIVVLKHQLRILLRMLVTSRLPPEEPSAGKLNDPDRATAPTRVGAVDRSG